MERCQHMNEVMQDFHPLIGRWFQERFKAPTGAQRLGWPAIQDRRDTLIAAPTGSGKTLTAFLASLDRLLRLALAGAPGKPVWGAAGAHRPVRHAEAA